MRQDGNTAWSCLRMLWRWARLLRKLNRMVRAVAMLHCLHYYGWLVLVKMHFLLLLSLPEAAETHIVLANCCSPETGRAQREERAQAA